MRRGSSVQSDTEVRTNHNFPVGYDLRGFVTIFSATAVQKSSERAVRITNSTSVVIWVGSIVGTCEIWVGESHQASIDTIALSSSQAAVVTSPNYCLVTVMPPTVTVSVPASPVKNSSTEQSAQSFKLFIQSGKKVTVRDVEVLVRDARPWLLVEPV